MKQIILTIALLVAGVTGAAAQGPNGSGQYYKNADGKKGAALKTALCKIIFNRKEGGSAKTAYDALWTHFQTTDKKANGKVWDMYSIKREFTFVTDQAGSYSKEGDVYNREHSFPQSWFGDKKMPMYADLFHLYPTDGYVNGMRGNLPFGETNGKKANGKDDFISYGGFSKRGVCTYPGYSGTVFEPNDIYKGDFARTYFYMVTCYEEKIVDWYNSYSESRPTLDGNTYPGLSAWQLKMLMEWATKDPVSDKETNRNNAVYGIQENRNPFIDYPGLEQYIWGDKKDVAFSYDNYDSSTAITTVSPDAAEEPEAIYTPDGQRIAKPRKGINILRSRSGKSRKVYHKGQ